MTPTHERGGRLDLRARERRRATGAVRGFVAVALVTSLVACVGTTSNGSTSPALSVKWLPPCVTDAAEPYFSVDVFEDGSVRYLGGAQAREVGERRARINQQQARQLVRAAMDAEGPPSDTVRPSPADERVAYCVDVVEGDESNRIFRASGDDTRIQPFLAALEDTVGVRSWVCPERYPREEWPHLLYQSRYCGGYAGRAALTFSIDESQCTSLGGRVYEGLIYYKRLYKSDGGTFVIADEGYRSIADAQFAELIEVARRSDLAKLEIEEPNARADLDYVGDTAADLSRLKQILTRLLGFDSAIPLSPSGCVGVGVSGSITLRYEFGPPLRGE